MQKEEENRINILKKYIIIKDLFDKSFIKCMMLHKDYIIKDIRNMFTKIFIKLRGLDDYTNIIVNIRVHFTYQRS